MKTYEKEFNEFWKHILYTKKGKFKLTQLKKELADYSMIIREVPKVYMAVTGNRLSKPNYSSEIVIEVYEEQLSKDIQEGIDEYLKYATVKAIMQRRKEAKLK